MPARTPRFGVIARQQQQQFRNTLSAAAQQATDDKAKRNPHLLARGHELENLYPSLRGADGACAFFAERGIRWWTNPRSGDRVPDATYVGPTRNLASSQVSCVNFLLPLASIPGALRALLQALDADVVDVEAIVDGQGHVAPVEFEWVGWREPLEGGRITRGANQTSIDALIVARTTAGRRAYLIEWKYCEEYLHPKDKGEGRSGDTRKARYRHLYEAPTSSFNGGLPFEDLLYEPFYQLMRMLLLGDRMLVEGVTETPRAQRATAGASDDERLAAGQSESRTLRAQRATAGASDDERLAAGQSESRTLRAQRATAGASDDERLAAGQSESRTLRAQRATAGASDDERLAAGQSESRTLRVDDMRVVVVCPTANDDYRRVVPTTPLGRRWPSGSTVRDVVRTGLKDPRRLDVVAQDELVKHLRAGPLSGELKEWLDYHALRYGW